MDPSLKGRALSTHPRTCSCITPPSLPISLLVNRLKGVSSRRLRQQYRTDVRKYLWGKHFWSPSYFAASCGGARLTVIKQDIEQQNRPN
jgi:putative transposase